MQSFDRDLVHVVGYSVLPVPNQAIDAGSDQEVCSGFPSLQEALVDGAPAITDMDASHRITHNLGGAELQSTNSPHTAAIPKR